MRHFKPLSISFLRTSTGWLLIILSAVSSCKKHDVVSTSNGIASKTQNDVANKILAYLENQKIKVANGKTNVAQQNANIDLLEENLDFNSASKEQLDNKLDFLIVPIKDELINKKNLDKNSTLILLLITDKQGKINSGSIVYFQPSDGQKHSSFPQNTFSNLFSQKKVTVDGKYKMLMLTGGWISQFEIKNGKLFSAGTVQSKLKEGKSSLKTTSVWLIDWYLITTHYWADGSVTTDIEYLGSTTYDDGDGNGNVYNSDCYGCPYSGGSTPTQPNDDIRDGEDNASGSDAAVIPSSNLSGDLNANGSMISVTWWAHVAYQFNYTTSSFINVNGGPPYPVPVSQPFIDDNGNPATLYCSTAPGWKFSWYPLLTTMYAVWNFIGIHTYVYTTGTIPLSFDLGLSKVCAAP